MNKKIIIILVCVLILGIGLFFFLKKDNNTKEKNIENIISDIKDIDDIQKEDVFSLVDTYFMPYGVECDQYSVLGEILNCNLVENEITKEEIYKLTTNRANTRNYFKTTLLAPTCFFLLLLLLGTHTQFTF